MHLYIYLANLFYYFILYQYIMCITLNVYIALYIVQHHRILLCKYGAIEINKHLRVTTPNDKDLWTDYIH